MVRLGAYGATTDVVGRVAFVPSGFPEANITQAMALIRVYEDEIWPETLFAFLAGQYGQRQIQRLARPTGQYNLNLQEVSSLHAPRFSVNLSQAIRQITVDSLLGAESAMDLQIDAEKTLLRTLGLENWRPPEPLTYTRPSRDAFAAGRLDAEYFAPRVAELLNHLKRDALTIGDMAPARHERFSPGATGSFNYIEIGGVRSDGTAVSESVPQDDAPSRATSIVREGDVITSTVRPIRRLSALIDPEQDGHVCSSGFVVLQPTAMPAEVLLTYLRLPPVCELMDVHTSASLYPAISELDLLAIPIQRIDTATQTQVVDSVRAAQAGRRRAAELLDAAKRSVEIAIEDSEAAALHYLNAIRER